MQSTLELLLKDFLNLKLRILETKCHFREKRKKIIIVFVTPSYAFKTSERKSLYEILSSWQTSNTFKGIFFPWPDSFIIYCYNFLKLSLYIPTSTCDVQKATVTLWIYD